MINPQPQRVVREIPANIRVGREVFHSGKKMRVCAYARVSSDSEEQMDSYKAQKEYYTRELGRKTDIEFVGLYADEARSGKSIRRREDFKRMLEDCEAGKIDRIVTKSVARFARNMVECMKTARDLKNKGITILFETQGIDTTEESSFVLLSLLATMAEEEIRTLSINIIWGFRKRIAEGKITHSRTIFGYKAKKGNYTIVPHEAVIVQEIFEQFLSGKTYYQIANDLQERGIAKANGGMVWQFRTIEKILENEKYCGDVITQKTFSPDIMLERRANNGELPKYEIKDNHIGIVSRETYEKAQAEIERRKREKTSLDEMKVKYSSKYAFSSRAECTCGSKLRRHSQWFTNKAGEQRKMPIWVCITHQKKRASCPVRPIKEGDLEQAFVKSLTIVIANREHFDSQITANMEVAMKSREGSNTETLKTKLDNAQRRLITISRKGHKTNANQQEADDLMEEIRAIQADLAMSQANDITVDLMLRRLKLVKDMITEPLVEFKEEVFRSLIEKAIVVADDKRPTHIKFIFYSGLEITQEL